MEVSEVEKTNPKKKRSLEVGFQDVALHPKCDMLTRNKKRKGDAQVKVKPSHYEQLAMLKEAEEEEKERRDELYERWLHSPERTKKWRNKMAKIEKAEAAKEEGPLADVWVQCENPDCLKWRRITKEQSKALDESAPWFCGMNPNTAYQECSSPQEDFLQVEREARRVGIKFIASSLPQGSLVWATMAGFCRWPALVTKDYAYGNHVFTDADDEPLSYHVEYLGQAHTRNWVSAQRVHLYGTVDEDRQLEAATSLPRKMIKTRRMAIQQQIGKKKSFWKKGVKCAVEGATREADELGGLKITERLQNVVFTEDSFFVTKESTNSENSANKSNKSGKSKKKEKDRPQTVPDIKQNNISLESATKAVSALCDPPKKKATSKGCVRRKLPPLSPIAQSVSGEEVIQRQLHSQKAMVECSNKEEKFTIDVQMYKKNEKAFEHDVRRFMIRQDRPITRLPEWRGVPVSLFQLFLAVYDRGGFDQVVKNRQFEQIHREMTLTNGNTGGSMVKKYYERNLLPYELYINHQSFDHLFMDETPSKPKPTKPTVSKTTSHTQEQICKVVQISEKQSESISWGRKVPITSTPESCDSGSFAGLAEKELQEIDNMLSQLDSFNEEFFTESSPRKASSIEVTFFDESPPPPRSYTFIEADMASNFGQACLPIEDAQTVPEMIEQELDFVDL